MFSCLGFLCKYFLCKYFLYKYFLQVHAVTTTNTTSEAMNTTTETTIYMVLVCWVASLSPVLEKILWHQEYWWNVLIVVGRVYIQNPWRENIHGQNVGSSLHACHAYPIQGNSCTCVVRTCGWVGDSSRVSLEYYWFTPVAPNELILRPNLNRCNNLKHGRAHCGSKLESFLHKWNAVML